MDRYKKFECMGKQQKILNDIVAFPARTEMLVCVDISTHTRSLICSDQAF